MATRIIFIPQPVLIRNINNRPYIIKLQLSDSLETVSKFFDIDDKRFIRYSKLDKMSNLVE